KEVIIVKSIVGCKFKSKFGEYEVIKETRKDKNGNRIFEIVFTNTGYKTTGTKANILKGLIKDRLLPTVCNVGILGYSNYAEHKKEYNIWCDIIKRCYNKKHKSYKSYGGKGVAVCDRWK